MTLSEAVEKATELADRLTLLSQDLQSLIDNHNLLPVAFRRPKNLKQALGTAAAELVPRLSRHADTLTAFLYEEDDRDD